MKIKDLVDENFQDYKQASMFICTARCNGKCWRELGLPPDLCQYSKIASQKTIDYSDEEIAKRYLFNGITHAIVIGGLEPLEQSEELYALVSTLRRNTLDPIIIYTGYKEDEIPVEIETLSKFPNIIVKFGRYIPNDTPRYDPILGVTLASSNQYAKKIS